jgi:arylsulfatase A-like enzyme
VVDRYYEYVDGLLSGLVEAAGPLASFVVVSDHGFEYEDPEHLAHEHGPDGVLILSGPAFRAGASLERTPALVDVAPTVLALLGLPLADTLAGAPVLEAFARESRAARPPAAVASYGAYAPPMGQALETPDDLQDEVMEKLRALGYVAE